MADAKTKVKDMLRKREEKLERKEQSKVTMGGKKFQKEEDKEIVRQLKNKKRDKRRARNEEDDFDDLFDKYKAKIE